MNEQTNMMAELRAMLPQCLAKDRARLEARLRALEPKRNRRAPSGGLEPLRAQAQRSHRAFLERQKRIPAITYPENLPITARKDDIISLIKAHPVVVISGETGSGKTTQIPKMCLEARLGASGMVACTQPRRLAALTVSRRIAEELGVDWGREVGCKIRFSDQTSPNTLIKMVTDGMLLAEIQGDADLLDYEAVIVDEAHERSLNIDFLLGYLKLLRLRRPDLKIIITSATIDTETFAKAFDGAPIMEVSGRTYPVEVVYRPLEETLAESGDFTYIEAAARAVEEITAEYHAGDVLVFMPGERDIRETCDLLAGRQLGRVEIFPLFGRLSAGDQQRIFSRTQKRKIIVATNVAETSLTIPGIRFVVDSGLARISRYSPNTRTQRLPIEPVAQSSAEQRKGRCGRVASGICYRLFDEQDFLSRPRYSQPEILRSNLAAVILRMIAFKIGEVESFPFVDRPLPRAISGGYQLLQDLGALDEKRALTPLGAQLARLPVDPTAGRMLLQARREKALNEVLIIAAGLSIQDPRERPAEKREEADRMHRRFVHPESDFLTLLNIWNAYHDECEKLSQRQLRRFCREHFLSYTRMREWRDLHDQLAAALQDLGEYHPNALPAEYDSIHRAILSGLPENVASRDSGNHYRASRNRQVMIFPGSALFDRKQENRGKVKETAEKKSGGKTPAWVLCGEWLETSRLYARMVARIEPDWILDLCRQLCQYSYSDPDYEPKQERVLVRERILLHGLEIEVRRVDYGKINPAEATEIFIRSALVEDELREQFPFLEHNRALRRRLEDWQTRLRHVSSWSLDERVFDFYARRLEHVSSAHDLHRWLKENHEKNGLSLLMKEEDLLGGQEVTPDPAAFPDGVLLEGQKLELQYVYQPGGETDGATLKVPLGQFDALQDGMIDWLVPGYLRERVECLLRGLPKETRKKLFPIADKVEELVRLLKPSARPLADALRAVIAEKYGVVIAPSDWQEEAVPAHLKPRVEIVDEQNQPLAAGRDWAKVAEIYRQKILAESESGVGVSRLGLWRKAAAQYERGNLASWSFGDQPESIIIGQLAGMPVQAYPGLQEAEGRLALKLFPSRSEAWAASRAGQLFLFEKELGQDLAWLQKELHVLDRLRPLYLPAGDPKKMLEQAYQNLRQLLFGTEPVLPLKEAVFTRRVVLARKRLAGLAQLFAARLEEILNLRQALFLHPQPYPGQKQDLQRLLPPDFLAKISYERLQELPRYLKAMLKRAERAAHNPPKDAEKAARINPYKNALLEFLNFPVKWEQAREEIESLRWLLEEYQVSIFAQELGTAHKVSAKKIETLIEDIRKKARPPVRSSGE